MTPEEQRESSDRMIAALLLQLGGSATLEHLDVMAVSALLSVGLWRLDGGIDPDGRFQLKLVDPFGKPVDLTEYYRIKKQSMEKKDDSVHTPPGCQTH